jgi:hypothetical protein
MSVQFNYKDGQSSTTGGVTDLYDEFGLGSNECFVKIEQYMDFAQSNGGHTRRVVLSTSSGRTFQTTPVNPETPDRAPVVLQAPSGQCITNVEGAMPHPLSEASYSPCSGTEDGQTPKHSYCALTSSFPPSRFSSLSLLNSRGRSVALESFASLDVAASLSLSLSLARSLARSLALESCRSHLTKRYGSLCCQPLHRPHVDAWILVQARHRCLTGAS